MKKRKIGEKMMWLLKSLLASYIVTGVCLLILAFCVYQFGWDEQLTVAGIVTIYIVSTFMGGFIIGKLTQKRKFAWGMVVGTLYMLLLFAISYGIYREINTNGIHTLSTIILCVGGGTLGGMLS